MSDDPVKADAIRWTPMTQRVCLRCACGFVLSAMSAAAIARALKDHVDYSGCVLVKAS